MRLVKRLIIVTLVLVCCVSFAGIGSGVAEVPKASAPMVTFVFDDGFDTDYLVAKPIFDKQGAVACSAIVTDWIDKKGFLSKEQVVGLKDAGWEIMSHTASHPKLRKLNAAQIEKEFSRSRDVLRGLGISVKNLVYPYNKSNSMVREIARRYYRSARGGENELNREDIDQYDLHSVSNRKLDLEKIEHDVDRAYSERAWLIIHQHKIDSKITLTKKRGRFTRGEQLLFSPSGSTGRHLRDEWFLSAGYMHMVVLTGKPQAGDTITGGTSGATALLNKVVYDQGEEIAELVTYVRTKYPSMRIVTINTALDLLGEPDMTTETEVKKNAIETRVDQNR